VAEPARRGGGATISVALGMDTRTVSGQHAFGCGPRKDRDVAGTVGRGRLTLPTTHRSASTRPAGRAMRSISRGLIRRQIKGDSRMPSLVSRLVSNR
jgi:hypothetical protein